MNTYHWIHGHRKRIVPESVEESPTTFTQTKERLMTISRRSVLAAAGAGFAALEIGGASRIAGAVPRDGTADADVAHLAKRSEDANAALMRGDAARFHELVRLANDFTLMSPFGGTPTHPTDTVESRKELGRFFKNGTFAMELVSAWATADMVVLALIERSNVEVGDLPAQDWALRVTLVYRREGADWRLAHRHADPLAHGISVAQSAALARGERHDRRTR